MTDAPKPALVVQTDASGAPTMAPTRKLKFGLAGLAAMLAAAAAAIPTFWPVIEALILTMDPERGVMWLTLIGIALGGMGVAVPAYIAKSPSQPVTTAAVINAVSAAKRAVDSPDQVATPAQEALLSAAMGAAVKLIKSR